MVPRVVPHAGEMLERVAGSGCLSPRATRRKHKFVLSIHCQQQNGNFLNETDMPFPQSPKSLMYSFLELSMIRAQNN